MQITENALYDGEQPSTAMNQLFIGGIPPTPGARDSALPRFELQDTEPQYAKIDRSPNVDARKREKPKLSSFRPVSSVSDTVELKIENEYNDIASGISNPSYTAANKDPYVIPYNNRFGIGTSIADDKTEAGSVSPYDYIDHDKLERDDDEAKSSTGDYTYLKTINEPDSGARSGGTFGRDKNSGYANDPSRVYANDRNNHGYLSPSLLAHVQKY